MHGYSSFLAVTRVMALALGLTMMTRAETYRSWDESSTDVSESAADGTGAAGAEMDVSAVTNPANSPLNGESYARVYESFSYDTGGFNGEIAESGLNAWSASGAFISEPGLTYTDASGNVLPVLGNKVYSSYKSHDAHAYIRADGWPASHLHAGRLNSAGATIWWSFLYNWTQRDGWENHRFALESTDGGYIGLEDVLSGGGTLVTFAGRNDEGAKVTGGSYNMSGTTFVLMKLATDASTNTVVDMWFDPLLDGGEAGLGALDDSLTIAADSADGVLHLDRIHKDQLGHSATFGIDEIRQDTSFEAVVGGEAPVQGVLLIVQ